MARLHGLVFIVAAVALPAALAASTSSTAKANPIRRVVNMLQAMQVKITDEGEKQSKLFDETMCACKKDGAALQQAIAEAEARAPQLESSIEESGAEKTQLESDVVQHKKDRDGAKSSIGEATAVRTKAASDFAEYSTGAKADIKAMGKAVKALEKGMGSEFLQSSEAVALRRVVSSVELGDVDRELLTGFLSTGDGQNSGYAPQSGEVVGILKQLKETTENDVNEATEQEQKSITEFAALENAKKKEIDVLTKAIEEKTSRIGEVGVELVNLNEDLQSTNLQLTEDTKFRNNLEATCAEKQKEFEEISKTRSEELQAIAETIKILNDDDALELFKKTLPTPSLLQISSSPRPRRTFRLAALHRSVVGRPGVLAFVQRAASAVHRTGAAHRRGLRGRRATGSFDKVIKMADEMVDLLMTEGANDEKKKTYCQTQLDTAEDEKKELELAISDMSKVIDNSKSALDQVSEEITSLKAGIEALDKEVSEQTAIRKEENGLHFEEMQSNTAAKELLDIAKNRLQKFYNPKLHTTTPSPEVSEEERISSAFTSLLQVSSVGVDDGASPTQYVKKTEESGGVIAMIDMLMAELAKEIQEADMAEKHAQTSYEQALKDAMEKRRTDSKFVAEKEGQKSELEASLQKTQEERKGKLDESQANAQYIASLHKECDWLVENFQIRKEARAGEVESLKKAKAVLSGADYSL